MTGVRIAIRRKIFSLAKGHQAQPVIGDLALRLDRGEFVCLVGPSGCGKSTLLNIVAGLDRDFDGTVDFDLAARSPRVGYVFQNPRLLPWRTVRQNIDLAADPADSAPGLVDHLLDVMGLGAVQSRYPERLSLGMSRRVAIVRAFAVQPNLLLMDEPFVSLDAPTARRIRGLLIKVWQERPHTVLFVTHDLREAIELADRLVFLSAGPMRVIAEVAVGIPRERRQQDSEIEDVRQRLIDDTPGLSGML